MLFQWPKSAIETRKKHYLIKKYLYLLKLFLKMFLNYIHTHLYYYIILSLFFFPVILIILKVIVIVNTSSLEV